MPPRTGRWVPSAGPEPRHPDCPTIDSPRNDGVGARNAYAYGCADAYEGSRRSGSTGATTATTRAVTEPFRLYDSMRRQKVAFEPLVPGKVGMYVCGPTTYAPAHIGHAYSAIAFDTVRRSLEFLGYEVSYVRNITDVDDKIIKRAQRDRRGSVRAVGALRRRVQPRHGALQRAARPTSSRRSPTTSPRSSRSSSG